MTESGDVDLNPGAARQAGDHARDSERLAAMRAAVGGVGGAGGLFGEVPGGDLAERALESAATIMADELGRTGLTVQDISDSAYLMAEIADQTDEAAHGRLVAADEAVQRLSAARGGTRAPSTSGSE